MRLEQRAMWRPGPELNRRTRICSPLHNHSTTRPNIAFHNTCFATTRPRKRGLFVSRQQLHASCMRPTYCVATGFSPSLPWNGRHCSLVWRRRQVDATRSDRARHSALAPLTAGRDDHATGLTAHTSARSSLPCWIRREWLIDVSNIRSSSTA